jgi:hypothetical protein
VGREGQEEGEGEGAIIVLSVWLLSGHFGTGQTGRELDSLYLYPVSLNFLFQYFFLLLEL